MASVFNGQNGPPFLDVRGLTKTYNEQFVLRDFSFSADRGDIIALVGRNGSGKSTVLKCLAGAINFQKGSFALNGNIVDASDPEYWQICYSILDDFAWFNAMTITDHLSLVSSAVDLIDTALKTFQLSELRHRIPASLSAGQRQRAALATVIVRPWQILCLDEPERHLDDDSLRVLAGELVRTVQRRQGCIVLATHSTALVDAVASRCIVMDEP